jgi:dCTP deaminase
MSAAARVSDVTNHGGTIAGPGCATVMIGGMPASVMGDNHVCVIPPNSFALARSLEYFRIPRKVLTVCLGKSTYARCGLIVNVTPFEPEWEGYVTLEISNTTPLPAKVYANEGLAQVLFFEADEECEISYADKKGKYQGQIGVTPPKL